MAAPDLDRPPRVEVVVSTGAALFLGVGIGVLITPLVSIGSALVAAVLHEKYTRMDEL